MPQTVTTAPADNKARPLGISIKSDRLDWINQTALANQISVSELVRRCIDAARKDPKRIGL